MKIISGGQTGVDRGALDAALDLGVACGGWCPAGRQAEDGPVPGRYPLAELEHGTYRDRTLRNVRESDGTLIIFFGELEGGSKLTKLFCHEEGRPCELIDGARVGADEGAVIGREFVSRHGIRTLNVAGPRASKQPAARDYAYDLIRTLLREP